MTPPGRQRFSFISLLPDRRTGWHWLESGAARQGQSMEIDRARAVRASELENISRRLKRERERERERERGGGCSTNSASKPSNLPANKYAHGSHKHDTHLVNTKVKKSYPTVPLRTGLWSKRTNNKAATQTGYCIIWWFDWQFIIFEYASGKQVCFACFKLTFLKMKWHWTGWLSHNQIFVKLGKPGFNIWRCFKDPICSHPYEWI